MKRSYIYGHIPKNFRTNTLLAGLCNLCEDYGYSNFANLKHLVEQVRADCQNQELSDIGKQIDVLQHYMKTKFSHEVLTFLCLGVFVNVSWGTDQTDRHTKLELRIIIIDYIEPQ